MATRNNPVVLKSINLTPNKEKDYLMNWYRIMTFLRDIDKIKSTYLWSQDSIVRGDESACWGFASDLLAWQTGPPNS